MSIANKPTIVIAAIASRSYVHAAVKAGFDAIAVDCFADLDTQRLAKKVYQVPMQGECLNSELLLKVLKEIDLADVLGLCYGAGFEMQTTLLSEINEVMPVIGNTDKTISRCKDPKRFFAICDLLGVMHPEVAFDRPRPEGDWLQKTIGAGGGSHIKLIQNGEHLTEGVYYQQQQTGRSISCLCLANEHNVQVLGFHEQWLDENTIEPYRYGGAATKAKVSELASARLTDYVNRMALEIGLVGLNSFDAIVDGDDVYILEINPRLSATVGLYVSEYPDLMNCHVNACDSKRGKDLIMDSTERVSHAHQVVYAKGCLVVERGFIWPAWAADIPEGGSQFKDGMPVCTVFGEAGSAEQSKSLVQERAATINAKLLN